MLTTLPIPTNVKDFHRMFPDDAACVEYFAQIRWPHGFVCPRKGCGAGYATANHPRGLIRCTNGHDVSITSGTALHKTQQGLLDWFWTAYLVSNSKPGVSALELQRQLGGSNYETKFMLLHKLRASLVDPGRSKLSGEVETDEIYVGGPEEGRPGRGAVDKAIVMVAVEVIRWTDKDGKDRQRAGRARMGVVPNVQANTIVPWTTANVEPGSTVVTDGSKTYQWLTRLGYGVRMKPASYQGKKTGEHLTINGLVVSNLKTWLQGAFHGAVSKKHLDVYLDEYVFRFNRRKNRGPGFVRCLQLLAWTNEPLEYEDLYHPADVEPQKKPVSRALPAVEVAEPEDDIGF